MIFYWSSLFLPFCLLEEEGPVVSLKYSMLQLWWLWAKLVQHHGMDTSLASILQCLALFFFIAFLDSYQMVLLCFTHLSKKIKTALYCSNIQLIKFMVCLSTVLLWLLTRNQCLCKYIWHHQNNVALILFLSDYIFAVMIARG